MLSGHINKKMNICNNDNNYATSEQEKKIIQQVRKFCHYFFNI